MKFNHIISAFFLFAISLFNFGCAPVQYNSPILQVNNVDNIDSKAPVFNELSVRIKPTKQNNDTLDFYDFIKGVDYVIINYSEEGRDKIDKGDEAATSLTKVFKRYLGDIGFSRIIVTKNDVDQFIGFSPSICNAALFRCSFNFDGSRFSNILMSFASCRGDYFTFESAASFPDNANYESNLYNALKDMFWSNIARDESYKLKIEGEMTNWNENKLREYYDSSGAVNLEGIYEKMRFGNDKRGESKYKIGVVKNSDGYDVIYISGANNHLEWVEGEIKARIINTAMSNYYKVEWLMSNKRVNNDMYCFIDENGMLTILDSSIKEDQEDKYLKLYPANSIKSPTQGGYRSSGTGFIISRTGLVVTNFHVIDGSNEIIVVLSENGKMSELKAKMLLCDKKNDLAIVQVDSDTENIGSNPPYVIGETKCMVGDDVFTLGFPLINTMGESIKLSNGKIGSLKGFQDDITSYQISAPIQPGNSGGPLFNDSGEVVGVVSAKHLGTEGVAYAIKSSYLISLLDLLPTPINQQSKKNLVSINLSEKVRLFEPFIVLIKVK
jgi:S1-C subfamily serine protease